MDEDALRVRDIPYHMGECYIGIDMAREEDEIIYYANGKEYFREVSPPEVGTSKK